MRIFSTAFALLVLGLTSCGSIPETDREYWMSMSIPFSENSDVPDKVEAECDLDTLLPEVIAAYSTKQLKIIRAPNPIEDLDKNGRTVLDLEFTDVVGRPGGPFTGTKKVEVRGELRKDGEILASFVASRRTILGGPGTCDMLRDCVKAIGHDIAPWLGDPIMDARLGDAR